MIKRRLAFSALFASTALVPLLWGSGALAAGTTTNISTGGGATDVGEVVVTATRKSEALSKVPESITAITAAKMDVLNIKSFADVAKFTPGVTFDSDSHDISIRGINSTAGSSTTGIYIDDTPIQLRNLGLNANNTLPSVFDLQRVEVLRGPQGTLFGAGSEGGTIRYITTQPSLTTYSGMARAELDFTQDGAPSYEAGVAVGGPIVNDKLGFRVSAWDRRDGGYIDAVNYQTLAVTDKNANSVDTYVLRAALTWAPTSNLTITPAIDYQNRDQHDQDEYWVSISHPGSYLNGTPDRMADPDHFVLPSLKIEWNAGPVKVVSDTSYYNRTENVNGYSGTLYNLSYFQHYLAPAATNTEYGYPSDPLGNACASCGSLYPLLTATGPNVPGMPGYLATNVITNAQQNFTQEVRAQSNTPSSRLQWTAGVFYSFNRQQSNERIIDPELPQLTQLLWGEDVLTAWGENLLPGGVDYDNNTRARDRQIALFGDATYAITEQLKLNVGLRYAWTKFSYVNTADGPQELNIDPTTGLGGPKLSSGGKSEQPFTPKVSLSYQITHDDMIYATAAKGYRIGGATPPLPSACGTGFPEQYASDSVWSYEAGSKDRFFDRKLQVSGSAYYIKWSNIQQAFYVPLCGIQFTTNAGEATVKGFDFQSQWQFTHAFDVELSVGYTDARFSKTAFDASLTPGVTTIEPANTLDVSGDSLDVVPWTVTLGAQYNFTVSGRDGFVRVDDEYASKRTAPIPNEDPNTAFYDGGLRPDPATNQVSIRTGLTVDKWDMALFVNNLFNSHPQLSLQHEDAQTLLYEAETLRPRTIGMAATYKF